MDKKEIFINLSKDVEDVVKVSLRELLDGKYVTCGYMGCIGNESIVCEKCIFADNEGDIILNPSVRLTLSELKDLNRLYLE